MPARYIPPGEPLYDKVRQIGPNLYTRLPLSELSSEQIATYIDYANKKSFPEEATKAEALTRLQRAKWWQKLLGIRK